MRRNVISFTLCAWLFALSATTPAQQSGKVPRLGYIAASRGLQVEAFRQHLKQLGYIEGNYILVEYRFLSSGGSAEAAPLVADLIRLKVDALVVAARPVIQAAKPATKTIPIVMITTQDPVKLGFIESLARPGGSITGVTRLTRELSGKRIELLKEMVPSLSLASALFAWRLALAAIS